MARTHGREAGRGGEEVGGLLGAAVVAAMVEGRLDVGVVALLVGSEPGAALALLVEGGDRDCGGVEEVEGERGSVREEEVGEFHLDILSAEVASTWQVACCRGVGVEGVAEEVGRPPWCSGAGAACRGAASLDSL